MKKYLIFLITFLVVGCNEELRVESIMIPQHETDLDQIVLLSVDSVDMDDEETQGLSEDLDDEETQGLSEELNEEELNEESHRFLAASNQGLNEEIDPCAVPKWTKDLQETAKSPYTKGDKTRYQTEQYKVEKELKKQNDLVRPDC